MTVDTVGCYSSLVRQKPGENTMIGINETSMMSMNESQQQLITNATACLTSSILGLLRGDRISSVSPLAGVIIEVEEYSGPRGCRLWRLDGKSVGNEHGMARTITEATLTELGAQLVALEER